MTPTPAPPPPDAVAGLLLRYFLACASEGIGPEDYPGDGDLDGQVMDWAEAVRPDLAMVEPR